MAAIDYDAARALLLQLLDEAKLRHENTGSSLSSTALSTALDALFTSRTQSYREVLLGCGLARILDQSIDIRLPYIQQGAAAFNGRTLDEIVVNPILQEQLIPCSKGPYLATFRRNVSFVVDTEQGLRDKKGYRSLLDWLAALEIAKKKQAQELLINVLQRFLVLRDQSNVQVAKIGKLSLDQLTALVDALLKTKSGGLLPVLLVVAMLRAIKLRYSLDWNIESQGINVADKASGASGDITVRGANGDVVLAIEVTERPIEQARVVATFNTKIVNAGIEDYLFIHTQASPDANARRVAQNYLKQGHEINFVQVGLWVENNLATAGAKGRTEFIKAMVSLLEDRSVPASSKLSWNEIVKATISA